MKVRQVAVGLILGFLVFPLLPLAGQASPPVGVTGNLPEKPAQGSRLVTSVDQGGPPTLEGTKIPLDWPNPLERQRIQERLRLRQSGNTLQADLLAKTGTDRLLVILVDFGGTDILTWTAPITPGDPSSGSQWDPYGRADPNEAVRQGGRVIVGDCSKIITQTTRLTYTGPLHNDIQRPPSADDRAVHAIWTEDFNPEHYMQMLFGDGILISYTTASSPTEQVIQDLRGYSLRNFYWLESHGLYTVTGDVIGWVSVPHSLAWYGADKCPGARSGGGQSSGAIPGAGNMRSFLEDTIAAINAAYPNLDWSRWDRDGDGLLDRVLIVHAWLGEEDATTLLNRPSASGALVGEHTLWSHKSFVNYPEGLTVSPGIALGPYTLMPENGGTGVFAHEFAHDLGTADLYSYGGGETSAGFWTLMADDWGGGDPYGAVPPELDPMHRDWLGWLDAAVWDPSMPPTEYILGEASNPPPGTERGILIELPEQIVTLPVAPYSGQYYYWGGATDERNAILILTPTLSTYLSTCTTATLKMMSWWDLEDCWDFGFVQASTDGGQTWRGITGTHTTREHNPNWYFTEDDLPGLTGYADATNECGPDHPGTWQLLAYTLTQYCGLPDVRLRIRYGTDWAVLGGGWYIDDIAIDTDAGRVFFDDLESGEIHWLNNGYWYYSDGTIRFPHRYYLEWRNRDGFDRGLVQGRYGINDFGLLIWYNNDRYGANEIRDTIAAGEGPSLGPKGMLLLVDSHFEPWRDPDFPEYELLMGWEEANLWGRTQMRDAAFSLNDTVPFTNTYFEPFPPGNYPSRPAVPAFHDSLGYYPGLEATPYAYDLYSATVDWDASVVIPAPQDYGVAPPNYDGVDPAYLLDEEGIPPYWQTGSWPRWNQFNQGWQWFGGTGNPGEHNYGVHVKILEQAPDMSWARIRVWHDTDTFVGDMTVTPPALCPGEEATFYLTLKDSASYTYTADVTVTLPPSTTLVGGSLNWSGELGGKVLHTPDGILTFTVQVDPAASYGPLTAIAHIVGSIPTKTYTLTADLMVGPRFAGDVSASEFIHPGDIFTYTITFRNEGCQANDPQMEDALPAGVDLITVTGGAWYSETAHTVYWSGEPLSGGEERTFQVVVQAHNDLRPGTTVDNLVRFSGSPNVETRVYAWSLVQFGGPIEYQVYLPLLFKAQWLPFSLSR